MYDLTSDNGDLTITPGSRPGCYYIQHGDPAAARLALTSGICDRIKDELRRHPSTNRARVVMDGSLMLASGIPSDDATDLGLAQLGLAIHTVLRPGNLTYREGEMAIVITDTGHLEAISLEEVR